MATSDLPFNLSLRQMLRTCVKGGEKMYHCGGEKVPHRGDQKELRRELGGELGEDTPGAGVVSSGVSQESSGWSGSWEPALCRLCLRR